MSSGDGGRRGIRRVFQLPFTRARAARELDAELAFHIHGRMEELMSQGMSRDEAEAEARRRFGNYDAYRSEARTADTRAARTRSRSDWLRAIRDDTRYAMRGMIKRPLYTTIVVLTLALGIGANTAIFSVVNSVLLHPLPTPALDRLMVLREDLLALDLRDADMSPGEAVDILARTDLFETGTAYAGISMNLTGLGDPSRLSAIRTMGDFFGVFGVRPFMGRLYTPEASKVGGPQIVVLSYGAWQQFTGSDPGIIGHSLELDDSKYQVIGVLPAEFNYPRTAQIYMPFVLTPQMLSKQNRFRLYMQVVVRLRPEVSQEQLAAQLQNEVGRWRERFSGMYGDPESYVLRAVPLVDRLAGALGPILLVLMGAVGLVLLIACANVGSLQLVRAAGRSREIAVRAALGAGRSAIVRQLLVESLVLAVAGGLLGLAVGEGILQLLTRFDPSQYAMLRDVHLNGPVLAFTACIVLLAGILFGVFPALRASRVDLHDVLKDSVRGTSLGAGRHRFLQGSVVVQIALTLVLLLASALTIRSLARLLDTDPGFNATQVMTMRLSLPGARYGSAPARISFYDALMQRLSANPAVQQVGLSVDLPFASGSNSSPFQIPGRTAKPNEPPYHANIYVVDGDYFAAMNIPVLRGRGFDASDAGEAVHVMIDATLAESFFGDEDPIGKQIVQGRPATIVGVVGNVPRDALGEAPHSSVYYPYAQYAWLSSMYVVIRSSLPSSTVATMARNAVREMDPLLPVFDVEPMESRVAASVGARRLAMVVLGGFAALSLVLALLGIYGVISYSTAQRTQELGIRIALGAQPQDVTRMVLLNGLLLAGVGVTAGLLIFLGLGRVVESLLYGVSPRDPATLASGVIVLTLIAVLATYIPARRAARVDPLDALRTN